MDLFKFTDPSTFLGGEPINGYASVAWNERYRDPSDFEIEAKLSSGLRTFLPEGTFISHTGTLEVMMVEDHQITEQEDADPMVKITGRSLQALLEQRIVGQNRNWASPPASIEVSQYVLAAALTWIQAKTLINDHIKVGTVLTASDGIPGIVGDYAVTGTGTSEERTLARGEVLARLTEILNVDDLGCRVLRRHTFPGLPGSSTATTILVHDGDDKRKTVIFSTKNGDITSADYLWSIKRMKTAALVSGKFVEQMVPGTPTGLNKRVMLVDGNSIDGHLEAVPTGTALTTIRSQMTTLGTTAIKAQKRLALSRIDLSKTPTYTFREDYNIGDLVSIDTNYGPLNTMRVVEYTEITDENGDSAFPTLEFLEI
jgi:hypothetical protein